MKMNNDKFNTGKGFRWLFLPFLTAFLFLIGFQTGASCQEKRLDWFRVAKLKPELKVLVLVESERALSLEDLVVLGKRGLVSSDRDPALVLGLRRAVFSTRLTNWMNRLPLPNDMKGKLLDRFILSGIYRTGFRVEEMGYHGPLMIEVTTPRNSFGKQLLFSENLVQPKAPSATYTDLADNRWFRVDYPEVRYAGLF
jgi:hypothetical protein